MFRISAKKEINFYGQGGKPGRAFWQIFGHKKYARAGLIVLLAAIGVGVWQIGAQNKKPSDAEVIQAYLENPISPDWLDLYFGSKVCKRESRCGVNADPDKDGLSNYEEFLFFADPTKPDTDGDGKKDGQEVRELKSPLGYGPFTAVRETTDIHENNPLADEFYQVGVEEIKKGNVVSITQILGAASKISDLPEFADIPFKVTPANSQAGLDAYVSDYYALVDGFLKDPVSQYAGTVADIDDSGLVNQYLDLIQTYANDLVKTDVPSDAFAFHRAIFGSLIYQSLIATTQNDFLQGQYSDEQAKERVKIYAVYYTRFLQDADKAAEALRKKYDFPISLSDQNQQP